MSHTTEIRIYFEDTDAGGVVYNANYLKFAERGRTELLRSLGFGNKSLQDQHDVLFVVRRVEADYLKPAFLDDLLSIKTSIIQLKNASLVMRQSFQREEERIFSMDVVLVCVDKENHKPVGFPQKLRQGFETYLEATR